MSVMVFQKKFEWGMVGLGALYTVCFEVLECFNFAKDLGAALIRFHKFEQDCHPCYTLDRSGQGRL